MNSTLTEVLDAARGLSRADRAEVIQELIATLDTTDEFNEARYAELRAAVDQGIASLDAGRSDRIAVNNLDAYLRERGRLATERAAAKSS
jgi:Arc/MetJ-type ribon-helix-helix transcriptional regulator